MWFGSEARRVMEEHAGVCSMGELRFTSCWRMLFLERN